MENTLGILDQQYADYQAMLALGLEQRTCIQRGDLDGLEPSFVRIHSLMKRIRLRQLGFPGIDPEHPEIASRCDKLRGIILEIQGLRKENQDSIQRLMVKTREELRRLGNGRRVARGYQNARVAQARLFDGTR